MPFGSFVNGVFKGMSIRDQREDMLRRRKWEDQQRGWDAEKHEWAGEKHGWARDAHTLAMDRAAAARGGRTSRGRSAGGPTSMGVADIIGAGYTGGQPQGGIPQTTGGFMPPAPVNRAPVSFGQQNAQVVPQGQVQGQQDIMLAYDPVTDQLIPLRGIA